MATTYSLLIDQKELNTKAISVVRKNLGLAMGEIRRRVAAGEPVHQCEAIDNDGIALIVMVHRELEAAGDPHVHDPQEAHQRHRLGGDEADDHADHDGKGDARCP